MKKWHDKNIFLIDSIIRYVLGSAAIFGVIALYLKVWVSLVSVYLICTAMLRWDPVYWLLKHLKWVAIVKADKLEAIRMD